MMEREWEEMVMGQNIEAEEATLYFQTQATLQVRQLWTQRGASEIRANKPFRFFEDKFDKVMKDMLNRSYLSSIPKNNTI